VLFVAMEVFVNLLAQSNENITFPDVCETIVSLAMASGRRGAAPPFVDCIGALSRWGEVPPMLLLRLFPSVSDQAAAKAAMRLAGQIAELDLRNSRVHALVFLSLFHRVIGQAFPDSPMSPMLQPPRKPSGGWDEDAARTCLWWLVSEVDGAPLRLAGLLASVPRSLRAAMAGGVRAPASEQVTAASMFLFNEEARRSGAVPAYLALQPFPAAVSRAVVAHVNATGEPSALAVFLRTFPTLVRRSKTRRRARPVQKVIPDFTTINCDHWTAIHEESDGSEGDPTAS
jgi:hypothetical protein